jgi:hypothetical protein
MAEPPTDGKTIVCRNCNHPTTIYPPPLPEYTSILLNRCPQGDSLEAMFYCETCNQRNSIFWDKTNHVETHLIAEDHVSEPYYKTEYSKRLAGIRNEVKDLDGN